MIFIFLREKNYFAQGVFRGETRKKSFFLGLICMWKRFFEKNPTIPEPLVLDEDETLMTSLLFLMTLHFRAGLALSRNI